MNHEHEGHSPSSQNSDNSTSGKARESDASSGKEGSDESMKMSGTHGRTESDQMAKGAPVIGEQTIWWAFAGLLIGFALGFFLGLMLGYGRINIPGLAPLVAGGAGVTGLLFGCLFGSLFGLLGAVLGTNSEARAQSAGKYGKKGEAGSHHGKSSFVSYLPIYGSIALALFMAYTLYEIVSRGYGSGAPSDQSNRVTWNQKNAVRVGGANDAETSLYVLQTAYPATRAENRPGAIVRVPDDWRIALAATPLIARPMNAALLLSGAGGMDANALASEVGRLRLREAASPTPSPSPSPSMSPSPSAVAAASPSPTPPTGPKMIALGVEPGEGEETIAGNDPATVAAAVDERLAGAVGSASPSVLVVGADADYRWALPAGAYSARTGTPILFVTKEGVPPATATALGRRGGRAHIFVLGPAGSISSGAFDQLKRYGQVTRIEGGDYFENSVRFAEFRDDRDDFGWGHTGRGPRQWSVVNTILVSAERWQDGVMAAHLSHRGKSGPLIFTERDRLPAIVDSYL